VTTQAPTRAPARLVRLVVSLLLVHALATSRLAAEVPTPETHFGFQLGTDGQLASAEAIEQYFALVAAGTDRVRVVDLGRTTQGHPTIAAIISAPENIRNLDAIREANQRLADPRTLSRGAALDLARTHKAVVAIGGSIHASEVGGTQAAAELLYSLATATDSGTIDVLRQLVVIVIPSLNPDGHRLVVDWYARTKGTPFEGAAMPWLDHLYAGHDINRDAFMMNLAESRNLARFFYTEWHPHVFLSLHQMGNDGPRMAVPPTIDPIDPNYDPLIWREAALFGGAMALELQRAGRAGVVSNAIYDYYWPGYEDSAPLGHNTVCLLAEVAGVNIATPITVSASSLRPKRGLLSYGPQTHFPDPWAGGRWTLRDIVDYDLSAMRGLLHAVSAYREQVVQNFYDMGARAVEAGERGGPFAFVIPQAQHDGGAAVALEELLILGAIEVHRALEPFVADRVPYPAGTDIILLAQPYRGYVKTLLERQRYPVRQEMLPAMRTASIDQPIDQPYDVAGWTLPSQMGVDVRTIEARFDLPAMSRMTQPRPAPARVWGVPTPSWYLIDARGNAGALAVNRLVAAGANVSWMATALEVDGYSYAPGSLVVPYAKAVQPVVEAIATHLGLRVAGTKRRPAVAVTSIAAARIGLYKSWTQNTDEGWTRWLLERYEFKVRSITDADARAGDLRGRFDTIIVPSASVAELRAGNPAGSVPDEYAGGLGDAGVAALKAFVEQGGTLICLDEAGALAIEELGLPIKDVARNADDFFCPGSLLALDVDPTAEAAYGMMPHTAALFASSSAYEVGGASGVRVSARYGEKDLLISGWLEGERVIAGRPATVEVTVGAGRVVLLGFPVQHRAQSQATFRLLFNAIFTSR
jgi:hypothetical protein